jgi:hypothetical protein
MPPNYNRSSTQKHEPVAAMLTIAGKPFPPLVLKDEKQRPKTVPIEARKQVIIKAPHSQDPSHPNNLYWDWLSVEEDAAGTKKQEIIDSILNDERIRLMLSAEHMERTLAVSVLEIKNQAEIVRAQTIDDAYWYDNNKICQTSKDAYWVWQSLTKEEVKQRTINSILEEDRCRQLLSTARIVDNIVILSIFYEVLMESNESLAHSFVVKQHQEILANRVSRSYWDW